MYLSFTVCASYCVRARTRPGLQKYTRPFGPADRPWTLASQRYAPNLFLETKTNLSRTVLGSKMIWLPLSKDLTHTHTHTRGLQFTFPTYADYCDVRNCYHDTPGYTPCYGVLPSRRFVEGAGLRLKALLADGKAKFFCSPHLRTKQTLAGVCACVPACLRASVRFCCAGVRAWMHLVWCVDHACTFRACKV